MLVKALNVTLADLMPLKGVAVQVPGEVTPYRISERLHAALKLKAVEHGVVLSQLLSDLRDEVNLPST